MFSALKPDISKAEKVADSIKCGEDLEDAMAQRDMAKIEDAKKTIVENGFEKEHVVQILEADKLLEKLRRLEKSKKDILEGIILDGLTKFLNSNTENILWHTKKMTDKLSSMMTTQKTEASSTPVSTEA